MMPDLDRRDAPLVAIDILKEIRSRTAWKSR
jgi:hypothetical protein